MPDSPKQPAKASKTSKVTPDTVLKEELFVCGFHDGNLLPVLSDKELVEVPTKGTLRSTPGGGEEIVLSAGQVYRRHLLMGDKMAFSVFAPETLSTDEMLAWLIAGYGKGEKKPLTWP